MDAVALESSLDNLELDSFASDADRKRVLRAATRLTRRIERPIESILRICWSEPPLYACLRIGIDVKLFEHLADNDGSPKSSKELADECGVDPVLMGRMLRHLASNGYINTAGTDRYVPTHFSRAILDPTIGSGINFMHDTSTLPLARLPEFLKRTGYKDPQDKRDSPWTFGMQTEKDHFPWLNEHPDVLQSFANHMSGYAEGRPLWMDLYPVKDRLIEGSKGGAPFMVDVGGSTGHDLSRLLERFPDFTDELVLQDQAPVIREATGLDKRIQPMPHDFFTPQPVKGARAYYLHSILHDWPDGMAVKILLNLKGAMTAGYSKIIINENIIPPDAAPVSTALDLVMMVLNTSSERTQAQWQELLSKAGFKVTGVWSPEGGESQGVIEAEVM